VNVWRAATELARAGQKAALATVAETRGSTPVPAGEKMLVGPEGRLVGTVGGGCVEAEVITAALASQQDGIPRLLTHHLNADLAGDLGLSCGGTVEIFVEPVLATPTYLAVLDLAADTAAGIVRTATVWDGGAVKTFEAGRRTGAPAASLSVDRRTVTELLSAPPRIVVFGAGHVGAAIARAAAAAGFRVVVVDDRPEFADPARLGDDTTVICAGVDEALATVALTATDAVVIATRGHRHDAVILAKVAASPADYVGLLGSKRKKAVITKALVAAGLPKPALERVKVPVGLAIGAVTAEEIAVSVVAELVAWRRKPTV
jgi:xanthine dehydrogenase accessory factor